MSPIWGEGVLCRYWRKGGHRTEAYRGEGGIGGNRGAPGNCPNMGWFDVGGGRHFMWVGGGCYGLAMYGLVVGVWDLSNLIGL